MIEMTAINSSSRLHLFVVAYTGCMHTMLFVKNNTKLMGLFDHVPPQSI